MRKEKRRQPAIEKVNGEKVTDKDKQEEMNYARRIIKTERLPIRIERRI